MDELTAPGGPPERDRPLCGYCGGSGRQSTTSLPVFESVSDIRIGDHVVIVDGKVYRVDRQPPDRYRSFLPPKLG